MNSSLFVPQRTAALLLQHWRSGDLLTELPASLRPETLKQGYDSQDQFFAAAAGSALWAVHQVRWRISSSTRVPSSGA